MVFDPFLKTQYFENPDYPVKKLRDFPTLFH